MACKDMEAGGPSQLRVCIVGAGLSGLITAHQAKASGFTPTLFDPRSDVGGLFNREDSEWCAEGQCAAYDELHLTISNYLMAFSESPPPQGQARRFWSRREYVHYLRQFSAEYDLASGAHFGTNVVNVARLADGTYQVTSLRHADQHQSVHIFDAVAVCTGTNAKPFIPPVPGADTFPGQTRHAGQFNGADGDPAYVDKSVVVVGFGESGADTFQMVSKVSKRTVLSLRSYPFVVQRLLYDESKYTVGEASDSITSPGHHLLHRSVLMWLLMLVASVCGWIHHCLTSLFGRTCNANVDTNTKRVRHETGWHSGYGRHEQDIKTDAFQQAAERDEKMMDRNQPYSLAAVKLQREWNSKSRFQTFATKNYSSASALVKESTTINTAGIERVDGSTVHFKDGRCVADVDTILWNTGFSDDLSFLESDLRPEAGARSLFKNCLRVNDMDHPTLVFVGWARPSFGGVPVCSEMVARYWVLLLKGEVAAPTKEHANTVVAEDAALYKELFPLSGLSTLVDLYCYMDSLACLIGCQPRLWRFILHGQFDLVWKYMYGQHIGSWYRLCGPGSDFERHAALIRELPVCLTPWNTVKHACANVVNSTGFVKQGERFKLMEMFNM